MNRKERRTAAKSERSGPGTLSDIAALLTLAETQRRNGHPNEADAVCARLLAMEPNHAQGLHMRGLLAHHQGRPADALGYFRQAPPSLRRWLRYMTVWRRRIVLSRNRSTRNVITGAFRNCGQRQ